MKSLIAQLLTAASLLTFAICGVAAAVSLKGEHEPHALDNMQSSLWTSVPTQIDRSRQSLERLPALAAVEALKPSVSKVSLVLKTPTANTGYSFAKDTDASLSQDVTAASGDECKSKYRSYRIDDNTYQPFGGGPRRLCQSALVASPAMTQSAQPAQYVTDNVEQSHVSWCRARYNSYRSSDDTYQPFGGAERRKCQSPYA
jgi:hypothetical protein